MQKDSTLNIYKATPLSNPKDLIEVEVGDSKQPDFKPQFKFMRWNNEVNFSMRAEEHPEATIESINGKIKYVTPEYEVHQYDKPDASDEGGFEFEWVLNSPPKSNVLTATVQTKELDFFYQPALTEEEIADGMVRPENVVGSYAVYHSGNPVNFVGGTEYRTGKAFHIYRPKAVDAQANAVWCDLNIDVNSGLLTVTVPQKFLDSASYPVIVDPTFGYTSVGATTDLIGQNTAVFIKGNPGESGVVQEITLYANRESTTNTNVKTAMWKVSDLSLVSGSSGPSPLVISSSTPQWWTISYPSGVSVSAIDYYIGYIDELSLAGRRTRQYYDTLASSGGWDSGNNFSTPTNLSSPLSGTSDRTSVYATYTDSSQSNNYFLML